MRAGEIRKAFNVLLLLRSSYRASKNHGGDKVVLNVRARQGDRSKHGENHQYYPRDERASCVPRDSPDGPYTVLLQFNGTAIISGQPLKVGGQSPKPVLILISEGKPTDGTTDGCFILQHGDDGIQSFSFGRSYGRLAVIWDQDPPVREIYGVLTVTWTLLVPVTVVDRLVQSLRDRMKLITDKIDKVDNDLDISLPARADLEGNGSANDEDA